MHGIGVLGVLEREGVPENITKFPNRPNVIQNTESPL